MGSSYPCVSGHLQLRGWGGGEKDLGGSTASQMEVGALKVENNQDVKHEGK